MTRSPTTAALRVALSAAGHRRKALATADATPATVSRAAAGDTSWSPSPVVATATALLPMPELVATPPRSSVHYVVSAIDDHGRQGDTSSVGVLGWQPGLRVTFLLLPASVGVGVVRGGPATLTRLGRIQPSVAVRRASNLEPGDRLLLAAHVDQDQLVAHTTAALDMMTAHLHNGGGPA